MPNPLIALNTNAIAATATSQARALPTGDGDNRQLSFYNDGPGTAFITLGASTVVATLPAVSTNVGAQGNATPVPAGTVLAFTMNPVQTHWAVICLAAGTANVYCTPGQGQ